MKKNLQTRLHNPPQSIGNCFAAVISCVMDLDSAENAIQIQEYFLQLNWRLKLHQWLWEHNLQITNITQHLYTNEYYLVAGKSIRDNNINHWCIYKNGQLAWGPHPNQKGLITEKYFRIIEPLSTVVE